MAARILCVLFGHQWDRRLRHGHPSKTCDRCQLREWASARPHASSGAVRAR